ncbi:hypothetical protein LDENG_00102330 [Lucifuga dentata]|nr:hypothetical protein LDENG_00102330 [Lucifuga dentata]
MLNCESMKISALVMDKDNSGYNYMSEDIVVLEDPPIFINVQGMARMYNYLPVEIYFINPIQETLTNCSLTVSGSGLLRHDFEHNLPDLPPNHKVLVKYYIVPYKVGQKTITADFDCSFFRDIKKSCIINVKP